MLLKAQKSVSDFEILYGKIFHINYFNIYIKFRFKIVYSFL